MFDHCTGMHYWNKTGRLPVKEEIRSLPISQKRGKGWTKKLPKSCLMRSPVKPASPPPSLLDVSTEELEDTEEDTPVTATVPVTLECSVCQEEGCMAAAVVYCGQCSDHLCSDCRNAHARLRITKSHILTEPTIVEEVEQNNDASSSYDIPIPDSADIPIPVSPTPGSFSMTPPWITVNASSLSVSSSFSLEISSMSEDTSPVKNASVVKDTDVIDENYAKCNLCGTVVHKGSLKRHKISTK